MVTLALCRPVPVLAEASVILAGAAPMRAGAVLGATTLANLGVSSIYAGVGATTSGVGTFLLAVGAALALPRVTLLVAGRFNPARF